MSKKKPNRPRIPVPKPTIVHKTKEEKRNNRSAQKASLRKEVGFGFSGKERKQIENRWWPQ